jgi:hypothetical protein
MHGLLQQSHCPCFCGCGVCGSSWGEVHNAAVVQGRMPVQDWKTKRWMSGGLCKRLLQIICNTLVKR